METDGRRISLLSFIVEGMDVDLAAKAEQEVRRLLAPFIGSPLELNNDTELAIVITDRMAEHVDRIEKEHGRQRATPYQREKAAVIASGIVLTAPGHSPSRKAIVFAHTLWTRPDGGALAERFYMVGYLLAHVLREAREERPPSQPPAPAVRQYTESVRATAEVVTEAFDADWTAIELCRHWLTTTDESTLRLSEIFGERFVAAVHDLGEKLSVFAAIDVQLYRVTDVGLDELCPRVCPLLAEAMVVFAHALALFAADDRVASLKESLALSPGFKAYILPEEAAIRNAIAAEQQEDRIDGIVAAFDRILLRLGLRIEDLPDGDVYVHVVEPVMFPILPDAAAGPAGDGGGKLIPS